MLLEKAVYLLYIIPVLTFLKLLRSNLHMLQLNSYRPMRFARWQRKNLRRLFGLSRLLGVIALAAAVCAWLVAHANGANAFPFIRACLTALLQILQLAYLLHECGLKAKKPLVVTNRIRRLYGFSLAVVAVPFFHYPVYSLYFMLIMPHLIAFLVCFAACLVSLPVESLNNLRYVAQAKAKLAKMPDLIVIGITGSFGKTSTKFAIYNFLSARYNVLMTPESYNTPMGVVRTIREQLNGTHEIFIVEMGAKQKGDIKEICDIVKPKYGVVTSVGEQHLETFKTLANITATKFELVDALPSDGIAFLNYDNTIVRNKSVHKRVVSYGSDMCDYKIHNIQSGVYGSRFYVTAKKKEIYFETRLLGRHNCVNFAAACAVACELGVPVNEQKVAALQQECVPHRLQLMHSTRYTIIDDAFNSNPAGAQAALDVLAEFSGVKVIMTPGMVELGSRQADLNYGLGEAAAEVCDYIILIGKNDQISPIRRGCLEHGFDPERLKVFATINEGFEYINKRGEENWVVLLENDLPDNF